MAEQQVEEQEEQQENGGDGRTLSLHVTNDVVQLEVNNDDSVADVLRRVADLFED